MSDACPVAVGEVLPLVWRWDASYDVGSEVTVTNVRRRKACAMGWEIRVQPIYAWISVAYVVPDEPKGSR